MSTSNPFIFSQKYQWFVTSKIKPPENISGKLSSLIRGTTPHQRYQIQSYQKQIILTSVTFQFLYYFKDAPQWFIPTINCIVQQHIPPPFIRILNVYTKQRVSCPQHEGTKKIWKRPPYLHNIQQALFYGLWLWVSTKTRFGKKFITPQKLAIIIIQLTRGSSWPLSSIPEEDRTAKNLEFIARGNHVKLLCPVRVVAWVHWSCGRRSVNHIT